MAIIDHVFKTQDIFKGFWCMWTVESADGMRKLIDMPPVYRFFCNAVFGMEWEKIYK